MTAPGGDRSPGIDRSALPYRPCVGVVLIAPDRRLFVARRIDTPDAWQMPQGGIDPGEAPEAAARRELREETGVARASLLGETAGWLDYDLPDALLGRVWRGRYRGQTQKWFAFRFDGAEDEIDLSGHGAGGEFDDWRWATPAEVLAGIVPFKRAVYEAVLTEFARLLR